MTTEEKAEKLYEAYFIEWDADAEEYFYTDDIIWQGETLGFDSYKEFLDFMGALSKDEKEALGQWRIEHRDTGDYISITDGIFDDVSFLSMHAEKTETSL